MMTVRGNHRCFDHTQRCPTISSASSSSGYLCLGKNEIASIDVLGIVGFGRRPNLTLRLVSNSLYVEPLPAVVVQVLARPRDSGDGSGRCGGECEEGGEKGGVEQHCGML